MSKLARRILRAAWRRSGSRKSFDDWFFENEDVIREQFGIPVPWHAGGIWLKDYA